ncbi:MAG: NUDIX hydrolase [Bacteroidota bacterium]
MYKIYINETPLILTTPTSAKDYGPITEKILILRYAGKKKFLLNIVNQLENSQRFERVVVFHDNVDEMWHTFQKIFKIIEAAGGTVFNENGEVLMIHRRKFWDLPKGKIDPGETPEQAGLREVQEETGIGQVELGDHITNTYHTYQQKGKRILKKTYWYRMRTDEMDLTPQSEEDIELAVWQDVALFLQHPNGKIYGSIQDVLKQVS